MNVRTSTLAAGCSLILSAALQTGCATVQKSAGPAPQPSSSPAAAQQPAPEAKPQILSGKVVETMNSGGYTYINLEKDGNKNWIAIPATQVTVGQEVQLRPGMEMGKFTSSTLKRTFDGIIFSSGLVTEADQAKPEGLPKVDPGAKLPQGHPALGQQPALPQGHPATGAMPQAAPGSTGGTISGKVVESMDGGGYTYLNVEKDGKKTWVAIPATEVAVGSDVELQAGTPMPNFTSKTLKKTFDTVIFSGGVIKK
ncbi:hypothetical protein FO488_00565 [Geobacter sp. FeAm09]|uniref:hypothetical protein n=1 Tax=Geobacter sp. FeAm09 TaxID=2597769 RepID=UPI0011EF06DA|nr:hypothetical protein [Geobacter sp. FeAm09]QEM66799.1 hypothetical protein FO488_00565 [Geobacter sp. FeAm09]